MKKNIIKILFLLLVVQFLNIGCSKQIDVDPEFNLDNTQINTIDDVERVLGGAYSFFRSGAYFGGGDPSAFGTLPDMISDNLEETGESLANYVPLVDWFAAADNSSIQDAWEAAYRIIVQVNFALANIDRFSAEDPTKINRIKGQALALRAYVHFDLLRYWAQDYDRNSAGLGIPYKTDIDILSKPPRLTVKESYDKIFEDLNAAQTALADVDVEINTASNKSRIDAIGAAAIAARINFYAGLYEEAISLSDAVLDARPILGIADSAAYRNIWQDAEHRENLWTINFDAGQGSPGSNVYFVSGNRSSFMCDPALRAAFTQNDIRLSAFIQRVGNREVVVKFRGRVGLNDGNVNWKVLRSSEILLIRAEAKARSGDMAGGLEDLNILRAARIRNFVRGTETGNALLEAIALERRKELFVEGHRFFDLKRTGQPVERSNGAQLPSEDRFFAWPIPFEEIQINPIPQNPGY